MQEGVVCERADELPSGHRSYEEKALAEQEAERDRRNAEIDRLIDARYERNRLEEIRVSRLVRERYASFQTWVGF